MRNKIGAILLLLAVGMAGLSCSKKSNPAQPEVITAMINGADWGASDISASFTKVPQLDVAIHANGTSGSMDFGLSPYTGIGTYAISGTNNAYFLANGVYNHADSGSIVITDTYPDGNNKTIIKGTFNFVADNNVVVTDGVFEVALELN